MFGIRYESWKKVCEMYFGLSLGTLKSYLQLFPFTKLTDSDKEEIKSKEFFKKYIDSGAFVLIPEMMHHSENFIQKADGSFRNSALISPILFLVLQSIGNEVAGTYQAKRPVNVEAFYAGNYKESRAKYKRDYDNFYKSVNAYAEQCQYFIKTDIKSFYQNINVNNLIERINKRCNNHEKQKISQSVLLAIKEFLLFCGNGFYPLIENSMASSYLATIIYLDEIDTKLYKFIETKVKGISEFHMVRYVDDLYILFSSTKEEKELNHIYNEIISNYSSILKEYGLTLNTSKCTWKRSTAINEELKWSMYDEVVNGRKHELGELFKGRMNSFLQGIQKATEKGITNKDYIELIDRNFSSDDIELAPMVVYNYFIYDDQTELKREENIEELSKILERDNSFLALDTKRLSIMVMQSGNNELIKSMLYHLFIRYRAGLWNSFDTSVAIAYLIQSKFQHIDLLDIVRVVKPQLYSYSCNFCRTSFMFYLRYGNCEKWERYRIGMNRDCRAAFLYFMYLCEQNRHGHLASYAYYKSFFDRMSANMAFLSGKNRESKKPHYNRYYSDKRLKELYVDIPESQEIIARAQDYRNKNPLIHASSELLGNNSSSEELQEMEKKLDGLIDSYSEQHYTDWQDHLRQN